MNATVILCGQPASGGTCALPYGHDRGTGGAEWVHVSAASLKARPHPGWFQDPWYPGAVRWWTGRSWTDQTRALSGPRTARPSGSSAGKVLLAVLTLPFWFPVLLLAPLQLFVPRFWVSVARRR